MASIPALHDLLIDELQDLFFAENLLLKALPQMEKAATNAALKAGFTHHLDQTRVHVARLAEALGFLGCPPRGKKCHAMLGLVKEGAEAIETKGPAAVRDAGLIGAAQRVEHYEIAGYGTARAFALALQEKEVARLLQQTLVEEGETNKKLTKLSVTVNADALSSDAPVAAARKSKR